MQDQSEYLDMTVEEIVHMAVNAQRIAGERQAKDVFIATEMRLYAYPDIKRKIAHDREQLQEIEAVGLPIKSKSILMFKKTTIRLTTEELTEGRIQDLTAEIAGNEYEIETIDKALAVIAPDPYKDIIRLKYFEGKKPNEVACEFNCEPQTAWRHGRRLIRRLAILLYGVAAVDKYSDE